MSGKAPERIESVDVLRGLFATSIMVYHCLSWTFEPWFKDGSPWVRFIDWLGIYGVEAFFMISAFSLFHVYRHKDFRKVSEWRSFLWKRVVRIAPLYWVAVLVAVAFRLITRGEGPQPADLLLNLSLLFGFVSPQSSLIIGGWSIGVELAFYAMFPLLVLCLRTRSATLVFATLSVLVSTAWQWTMVTGVTSIAEPSAWAKYVALPMHVGLFGVGILVYELWPTFRERARQSASIAVPCTFVAMMLLATFASQNQTQDVTGWVRLASIMLCGLLCFSIAALRIKESGLGRSLMFLGTVSYSVYLLHPFVYQGLKLVRLSGWMHVVATIALTLPFAALVYRYLEQPSVQWGRRVAERWTKADVAT